MPIIVCYFNIKEDKNSKIIINNKFSIYLHLYFIVQLKNNNILKIVEMIFQTRYKRIYFVFCM